MKRVLAILIFLSVNYFSSAQMILTPGDGIPVTVGSNVLTNPWAGGINAPILSSIDVNGDGILDLFCYDQSNDRITVYVNDGTQTLHAYHYDAQYAHHFPKPPLLSWAKCADYNCDGKMDLFMLDTLFSGIQVWRNDYSIPTGLTFTKVSDRLMESWSQPEPIPIPSSRIYVPSLIDMDNDGDLDILSLNPTPNKQLSLHRNMSLENYSTCDSLSFKWETQCWGNFLLATGSNKVETFGTTCLPPEQGDFREPIYNPSDAAQRDDTTISVFAIDIDGDGAKDVLIGDLAQDNTLMVHNGGTPRNANADIQDTLFPSYDTPINISQWTNHAYIDADNDTLRDLIASCLSNEDKHGMWLYKNVGTDAAPVFNFVKNNFMQDDMIDEGESAAPVFFDYDNDGLIDMVIGYGVFIYPNISCRLALYKNTGTPTQPAFKLIDDDYAGLSAYPAMQTPIRPAFGDLDGDGDADLLIGDNTGKLYYFNNTAGTGNIPNFQFTYFPYMNIRPGNDATPQIIDLDRDGLPDLVIGEQNGTLNFYRNTGTSSSAFFSSTPTIDTLGFINVSHSTFTGYAVPYVFSDSGHYEVAVSNMYGDVVLYSNIDGNLNGAFTVVDTLIKDSLGVRTNGIDLAISGGDINNDGKTDFAIGLFTGGVKIYYGNSPMVGINELSQPKLFEVFPNPVSNSLNIRVLERLHHNALKVCIYNSIGEKVFEVALTDPNSKVDTRNFAPGTYFVQVVNSKTSQFMKIIVTH